MVSIHLFIKQMFTEYFLCAKHYSRFWNIAISKQTYLSLSLFYVSPNIQ